MYQYDDPTVAASLPVPAAPGTGGYFTDANPGGSIKATRLRADFMNMMMMEMLNVVTGVGLTPSKTTYTQLFTAMKTIVQQETGNYAADTGAANAYAATYNPAVLVLTDGLVLRFKSAHVNTGASTFAVNAIAAKAIVRDDGLGTPLLAGDIPLNAIIEVVYDLATTRFTLTSVNQNLSTLQIQQQTTNYAVAAGTGNAITATYAPVVASHITGMPLRFKATANNSGATTFDPGVGVAKNIIGQDGGALIGGEIVNGGIYVVMYDGTSYQLIDNVLASTTRIGQSRFSTNAEAIAAALTAQGVTPAGLGAVLQQSTTEWLASNLQIIQNAGTPTTQIDVTADKITMLNANGLPFSTSAFSHTINAAANGAIDRLDTGALANNTCYDVWAIAKSDGTGVGAVLSLASNTATNFPGATMVTTLNAIGYTGGFYMRLGTVQTGGAATFRRTVQNGRTVQNIVAGVTTGYPVAVAFAGANGSTAVPTYVTYTIRADSGIAGAMVPAKCKRHKLSLGMFNISASTLVIVAPTANYGAFGSITNPAPIQFNTNNTSQTNLMMTDEFAFEGGVNTFAYANNGAAAGNGGIFSLGWTESVNAS